MKKSIFDLTFEEGVKVDLEIRKTSYYKQYLKGFILTICMLLLLGGGLIGGLFSDENVSSSIIIISIIVMIGFASLMSLIFWFKRFDLMKQYYEEKNSEKK